MFSEWGCRTVGKRRTFRRPADGSSDRSHFNAEFVGAPCGNLHVHLCLRGLPRRHHPARVLRRETIVSLGREEGDWLEAMVAQCLPEGGLATHRSEIIDAGIALHNDS